ncbi:hypothetical protein RND71_040097 [Anisodus tanguticus]|uniref:S-protein homolog n=1 Tax=Anisodus tanguticus TaxID=243964 RepID=A0AAE1QYG0_9SOLA|nr:hypothetical protein RND71_040097 [Anisodus tanguticus]
MFHSITIKIIFLLFITSPNFVTPKSCWFTHKIHMYVLSQLPYNSDKLEIHCASKNNDFAHQYLNANEVFHWQFCNNVWHTTKFFCHFWWESKERSFEVFNDQDYCINDGGEVPYETRRCVWAVFDCGFYLGYFNGSEIVLNKYMDW